MVLDSKTCPSTNTAIEEQSSLFSTFWDSQWTASKTGWTISGGCAVLTTLITLVTLTMHARNYQVPAEQRQIMRILMMPCVYAIVSFLSYRYFRAFTYFELAQTAYEGICLSAFLLLLVELVSASASQRRIQNALARKEKETLPMTFGLLRFRASKPYFIHLLKWSVLQYVIFRPLLSIIGIICEVYDVLCPDIYSVHFAEVYLVAWDFVVISVALYGLIVFYTLTKNELKGKSPLSKFMSIKMIVFFTFYQSFVFSTLQSYGVIKATEFWTATNVADGLNALCTSIEMVFFAIWMAFAFSPREYSSLDLRPRTVSNYFRAIWDAAWLGDFALELWHSSMFFVDYARGRPGTRSEEVGGLNHRMEVAFGAREADEIELTAKSPTPSEPTAYQPVNGGQQHYHQQQTKSFVGGGSEENHQAQPMRATSSRGRDADGVWR